MAARLARLVEENADELHGVTNRLIHEAADEICPLLAECRAHERGWGADGTQVRYSGLFSSDTLPNVGDLAAKLDARPSREMTFIVNLLAEQPAPVGSQGDDIFSVSEVGRREREEEVTGHFVMIHCGTSGVTYVDPFGTPPEPMTRAGTVVWNFMRQLRLRCRRYAREPMCVQVNETAIQDENSTTCGLFCLLFVFALELDIEPTRFHWFDGPLRFLNDERCVSYIRRLLGPCLHPREP